MLDIHYYVYLIEVYGSMIDNGNVHTRQPIIIWRLIDGKPGHQNQSEGLVAAIERRHACRCYDIPVQTGLNGIKAYLSASWSLGKNLPLPDLIIGAGHRTHIHLLAARKAYGGKAIVLMKPSLPASLFDLSIIPEHDQFHGFARVLQTKGVLNSMRATGPHHPNKALIMVGGPSKHYDFDMPDLIKQIKQLVEEDSSKHYTVTTSRRTPASFVDELHKAIQPCVNLEVVSVDKTKSGWVAEQLADVATAWISEDSVSMIYEVLTARVAVGILNMTSKRESRLAWGINQLIAANDVVRFDTLGAYKPHLRPSFNYFEADRCAEWLHEQWLMPMADDLVPVTSLG
tara:strand:+ start:356 stop:1384 length:1029 start_codon:yes stop_codon:yes gene_type:complete